jgi:hypothetical protein
MPSKMLSMPSHPMNVEIISPPQDMMHSDRKLLYMAVIPGMAVALAVLRSPTFGLYLVATTLPLMWPAT